MMLYGPRGILNLARGRERKDGERGQIMVLFTLVIVLLMVLAAVVIDAGLLRTDTARLQNALDAGALAAARSLPATSANVVAVETTAISYAGANFPGLGLGASDITYKCIIGADSTTGLPRMFDMPAVCNVPLAANSPSWVCTAAVCWAPCDPRAGNSCNTIVLTDSVTRNYTFGRAVGINSGNTGAMQAAACTGPCGPISPVDLVLTIDRTGSMDGRQQLLVDGAHAVMQAYDPDYQHIALGMIGPSSQVNACSTGAMGKVLPYGTPTVPTYRSSSTNNPAVAQASGGATTLVINRPSSTASGDLLIAAITLNGNVTTPTPSGWTRIRVVPNGTNMALVTYWKIATGSEPANYTWTLSASGRAVGSIMRFTDVNPADPIDTSSQNTGSGTAVSATGVTTSSDNALLIAVYGTTAKTTITPTAAQGFTERYDIQHANASGPTIEAATKPQNTAAASGNKTATASLTGFWAAQLLAINPAETYPAGYPTTTPPYTDVDLAADMSKWIPVGLTGTSNADINERYKNANGSINTSSTIDQTVGCVLPPNDMTNGTDQASPFDFAKAYLVGTSLTPAHARPGVTTGIIFETDGTPQTSNFTCQQAQTAATAAKNAGIEVFTIGFFASNSPGTLCPEGRNGIPSTAWTGRTIVQSLAAMATNSATIRTNACDTIANSGVDENTDNDHFFCTPDPASLADVFRAAAVALAKGTRLVQLYPQPVVTGVGTGGGHAGGATITITGKYFDEAYSVSFGGTAAASFTVVSNTQIRAVTPAGPANTAVLVQVSTPGGSSSITGPTYQYGP